MGGSCEANESIAPADKFLSSVETAVLSALAKPESSEEVINSPPALNDETVTESEAVVNLPFNVKQELNDPDSQVRAAQKELFETKQEPGKVFSPKGDFNTSTGGTYKHQATFDASRNLNDEPEKKPQVVGANKVDILTSRLHKDLAWHNVTHLDLINQVHVKENAAQEGLDAFKELYGSLQAVRHKIPSANKWINRLKDIQNKKGECRILVGFLGTTGAGKSSLINAILEQEDLLPADDEKSCTAVCVEIGYNNSRIAALQYRAEVEHITETEWRNELANLYKDISDEIQMKEGEDGEPDLERSERIISAFQKINCVYPHIKNTRDLQNYGVDKLIAETRSEGVFGNCQVFTSGSREEFAGLIKPFIDSSHSKLESGKSFAQWPLVKVVRLRIPSQILKDGVFLVDLPGSHDTNAARGAIAEGYQKNLAINCVVAPVTRASSDKPAQELLGEIRQRTLQLDNRFTSDRLCFIISKSDSSLKMDRYIKTHLNLEARLEAVNERESHIKCVLDECEDFIAQKNADASELQRKLAANSLNLANAKKGYPSMRDNLSSDSKKRKAQEGEVVSEKSALNYSASDAITYGALQDLKKERRSLEAEEGKILKLLLRATTRLQQLRDELDACKSRKTRVCMQNRHEVSEKLIRKDYEAAASVTDIKNPGKPLQVFSVSSLAFTSMFNGQPATDGFLKMSDTGIPRLQKWLSQSTLLTRKANAESLLESMISFQLSIESWIQDTSVHFKMSVQQRRSVDENFKQQYNKLMTDLNSLSLRTIKTCDSTVLSGIFVKMPQAEKKAEAAAELIVTSWAQKPVLWSTHRATNRALGTWRSSKGVEYLWNKQLAGAYLDSLLKVWTETLHKKLPALCEGYVAASEKLINDFLDKTCEEVEGICPRMADPVKTWKENAVRSLGPLKESSTTLFNVTIQDGGRQAHRDVIPIVLNTWKPVYTACGAATGTGHFKQNLATHAAHVKDCSRQMYKKCSGEIRASFRQLWKTLPEQFKDVTDFVGDSIQQNFDTLLDSHRPTGNQEFNEAREKRAKERLRTDVTALFENLSKRWKEPPKLLEIEPVEEEAPEVEITMDDLLYPSPEDFSDGMEFDDF